MGIEACQAELNLTLRRREAVVNARSLGIDSFTVVTKAMQLRTGIANCFKVLNRDLGGSSDERGIFTYPKCGDCPFAFDVENFSNLYLKPAAEIAN